MSNLLSAQYMEIPYLVVVTVEFHSLLSVTALGFPILLYFKISGILSKRRNSHMEHMDEKGLSGREIFFVLTVTVLFITLIWRFAPIQTALKIAILCFGGVFVMGAIAQFCARIPYFIPTAHGGTLVAIVSIVFLLFPFAINILYESNKQEYLTNITPNSIIGLKIEYDIERTGGSGSIGSEWKYQHHFNDIKFTSGETMEIKASAPFTIRSRFIESDEKISDIGETTSKPIKYYNLSPNNSNLTIKNDVFVMESGGKRYAGSFAEFTATYNIKLTIPPSKNYWDIYFYSADNSVQWIILLCQFTCLFLIAYVIIVGERKKEQIKEQERIALEEKKKEERDIFIKGLNGKTIREIAGVPANITYENGLPRDNNNQRFGSYTAYITKSGSCFHRVAGCCSARYPIHTFIASEKYKPCSKCRAYKSTIPVWHKTYIELVQKCKEYSIEYE